MKRTFSGALINPTIKSVVGAVKTALRQGTAFNIDGNESFDSALATLPVAFGASQDSVDGMEGFGPATALYNTLTDNQKFAMLDAASRDYTKVDKALLKEVTGVEGFDNHMDPGSVVEAKAASISLNGLSQIQTKAAEAMFPTVTIGYNEENLNFRVRSAGIGRYIHGMTAFTGASELRPITSLLRDGKFFMKDTLGLNPNYPEKAEDPARKYFVPESKFSPWEVKYDPADPLGRQVHRSNYLAIGETIPNLMGLCEAPGQQSFNNSDTIESNSISADKILVEATVGTATKVLEIDVNSFSNRTFGPSVNQQSSDDRSLNMTIRRITPKSFLENGEPTAHFAPLMVDGLTPYFTFTVTGTFIRQTNRFSTSATKLALDYIQDKDGNRHTLDTDNAEILAIMAKFKEGSVIGADFDFNHSNTNRTNFGYRMEVYDTMKVLGVRKETPISVQYPVNKDDVNDDALEAAIENMVISLQANTTAKAFAAAENHIALVAANNGSAIVGNEQASNIPAGMHYVNATYLPRKVALKDMVSALDSITLLEAIERALTAEVSEIIAALATNSSLSAISEYRNQDTKWVIVGHQNILRYMIRQGESRTVGQGVNFRIEATNLDTMIGKFYIFPESNTEGTSIDYLGGMGITVAKTHQVYKANVTRDNKDFAVMVTQPSFQHHSVCPVVGILDIEDAFHALDEEGLIRYLSAQRVKLVDGEGKVYTATGTSGEAGGDDVVDLP